MRTSAIYEGVVRHRREGPRPHAFQYRLFLMYLDLDELPGLFRGRWFWSARGPNLAWFRRADYMGPTDVPLRQAVLDRVEGELGRRPKGGVRVLTHLRTFGYVFNPVTFYFCHDEEGALDAFVAEITNTPWKERHAYVLDARRVAGADGDFLRWRFARDFHVSPFFDMDQTYEWSVRTTPERLDVHMTNWEDGRAVFHAGLATRRVPITGRSLAAALVRHPLLTLRVHAAIYWQATRLWLKRTPFFTHPDKRPSVQDAPTP